MNEPGVNFCMKDLEYPSPAEAFPEQDDLTIPKIGFVFFGIGSTQTLKELMSYLCCKWLFYSIDTRSLPLSRLLCST